MCTTLYFDFWKCVHQQKLFPSVTVLLTPFTHFALPPPSSPLVTTTLYHFTQSYSEGPSLGGRWPPAVFTADYSYQVTGDSCSPTTSSVQLLQKNIAQRVRAELICRQGCWDRDSKAGCFNRHQRFSGAAWVGLGKEGRETMPCKSDFTDTMFQPDQNQLCAKWLITVSLKYSRSCCLFLGWKKI